MPTSSLTSAWPINITGAMLALLLLALLSDTLQIHGAVFSYDFRLWQVCAGFLAIILTLYGYIKINRTILAIAALSILHICALTIISSKVPLTSLIEVAVFIILLAILYSSVRTVGLENIVNIYFLAGTIVSLSIFVEFFIYNLAPPIAEATIYQLLKKDLAGPGGMLRAHGLMMEPSQVALIVPPALFLSLQRKDWISTCHFSVSCILTFSTLTYLGAITSFSLFALIRRRNISWPFFTAFVLSLAAFIFLDPVRDRVLGIVRIGEFLDSKNVFDLEWLYQELRGSVGMSVIGAKIAFDGFVANHFLGVGMGNLDLVGQGFLRLIDADTEFRFRANTALLAKVGTSGSLLLRMLGEFGVLGLFVFASLCLQFGGAILSIRKLYQTHHAFRYHELVATVGISTVVIVPFLVRKDAYINIYLLLPMAAFMVALPRLKLVLSRVGAQNVYGKRVSGKSVMKMNVRQDGVRDRNRS